MEMYLAELTRLLLLFQNFMHKITTIDSIHPSIHPPSLRAVTVTVHCSMRVMRGRSSTIINSSSNLPHCSKTNPNH
jgi:hypothetical protein